jgi:putative addiction module component (TIGR02574 family)
MLFKKEFTRDSLGFEDRPPDLRPRICLESRNAYDDGMGKVARKDILSLSVAERIELIGDLWDSLAETPEAVPLTDAQKAELKRRLEAYRKDPTAVAPWSVVRDSVLNRKWRAG